MSATIGPWFVGVMLGTIPRAAEVPAIIGDGDSVVAILPDVWNFCSGNSANARLIAAAPDLLALAQQYASECAECSGAGTVQRHVFAFGMDCDVDEPCPKCADIRAVIANATGGAA